MSTSAIIGVVMKNFIFSWKWLWIGSRPKVAITNRLGTIDYPVFTSFWLNFRRVYKIFCVSLTRDNSSVEKWQRPQRRARSKEKKMLYRKDISPVLVVYCTHSETHVEMSSEISPVFSIGWPIEFHTNRRVFVSSFERKKTQVSSMFLSKVIQKIFTATLFWNGY